MERCTTFLEHFLAGHFGTVQTSSNLDLNTLSASAHSVLDSHLDGTTVSNLALYLAGDVVAHDVGVELRLLNLEDVDLDVLLVELLELFLELVNILSTLPMTIPGRAVQIVMVMSLRVRSITMRETLAFSSRLSR